MPLNLTPEQIGRNTAIGITSVRKILRENAELKIDNQRRVASISDPIRRHWTEVTLAIRESMVCEIAAGLKNPDEDDMMNAFFADLGNDRIYDVQTAAEIIMHSEGRLAEMILERYYSTDSLWLINRVRNVMDRFLDCQPTTDRTNGMAIIAPNTEFETEYEIGEAGVTLKDPLLNQTIGWGLLAPSPEVAVIFSPEDPPEAPIILHTMLKTNEYAKLGKFCNFGISKECRNQMDKLLAFPLGNSIDYDPCCNECAVDLLDFIDEPERDENGDLIILAQVEA